MTIGSKANMNKTFILLLNKMENTLGKLLLRAGIQPICNKHLESTELFPKKKGSYLVTSIELESMDTHIKAENSSKIDVKQRQLKYRIGTISDI